MTYQTKRLTYSNATGGVDVLCATDEQGNVLAALGRVEYRGRRRGGPKLHITFRNPDQSVWGKPWHFQLEYCGPDRSLVWHPWMQINKRGEVVAQSEYPTLRDSAREQSWREPNEAEMALAKLVAATYFAVA